MQPDIEKIIRQYLPDVIHMSLGTCRDGKPWVCEVHFAYDEDLNLYFRSKADRRHSQEIADNPNVAGDIVRQHQAGERPTGVYFEGTAKLVPPSNDQAIAFQYLKERFAIGSDAMQEATRPDGHKFYKVSVQNWYVFGELEPDKGSQKYQLPWNGGKE